MRRLAIRVPDDLAAAIRHEADRRRIPVFRACPEAPIARLPPPEPACRIPFAALGASGSRTTARDAERILRREWGDERLR